MTRRPSPESAAGAYLSLLARGYADKARVPKATGKLTWTEALAKAPWSGKLPAEQEEPFRRAYAERLVERGLALPVGRSRTSGPSGETDLERCIVYLSTEERDSTRALAKAAGVSWSAWARRKLLQP